MARRRGRPLAPIKTLDRRVGQLAHELRRARLRLGISRPELAVKVSRSVATIHRAEAGRVRVPWPVTRDIAVACHMDLDAVERMWLKAGRAGHTRLAEAPRVTLIRTAADLAAALRRVWQENNEPSVRKMEVRAEARAQDYVPLSRMSAWRIRQRKQATSSLGQLCAYLIACEVPEADFPLWAQAWARVRSHELAVPRQAGVPVFSPAMPRGISPRRASAVMLEAGLQPLDPFPGATVPWTARCQRCGGLRRYKLSRVQEGTGCPACSASAMSQRNCQTC
ncbi:helix-turn-helix domain-containing protein [Streptomyces sp. NPDC059788]|uniref:helix-turn-helix domain-containing protein n=1 Tax=Streptomyces sp. NPDC059788 TaxID=3346948 RepID=UPI00365E0DDD